MTEERSTETEHDPDASDVVTGPVGDASLRDPATSGPMGADLEGLAAIEVEPNGPTDESDSTSGSGG